MNKIKDLIKNFKQYSRYIIFGLVVFTLGLVWHFPFHRIGESLQQQIRTQTNLDISFQKMNYALPIGIKLKKVQINNIEIAGTTKSFSFEEVKASISPLSALTFAFSKSGTVHVLLREKALNIKAKLGVSKESLSIRSDIKKVKLDQTFSFPDPMNPAGNMTASVSTILNGSIDVEGLLIPLQKGDLTSLEGDINLKTGATNINAPIVNELNFDQVTLKTKSAKGKMVIQSLNFDGPMLNAKASGALDLRPVIDRSILKLDVQMNVGSEGQKLKPMLNIAGIRLDADGAGALKVTGPLNQLRTKGY